MLFPVVQVIDDCRVRDVHDPRTTDGIKHFIDLVVREVEFLTQFDRLDDALRY